MEKTFSFRITPVDSGAVQNQMSRALEKRMEMISRNSYPFLWSLTDRFGGMEKAGEEKREKRKKRRAMLGSINWMLGLFLLIPGILYPGELEAVAAAGAVALGAGSTVLWKNRTKLLGILSLPAGLILCLGAWGDAETLRPLLWLGIAETAIGIISLWVGKKGKNTAFDRAAMRLIRGRAAAGDTGNLRVVFSDSGMSVVQEENMADGSQEAEVPYDSFGYTAETEDLILMVYGKKVLFLKKSDLLDHSFEEFRQFFSEKTGMVTVV